MTDFDAIRAALGTKAAPSSDFDLNKGFKQPEGRKLRPAAVLVPLIQRPHGINVILTKRASHLKHHPGQVAFPGGKVEDHDNGIWGAALRETQEEIGLSPDLVDPLGELANHETVTSFTVHPVVGAVTSDFEPRLEENEVAEVFEAPLSHVTDPANFAVEYRMWQGQQRRYFIVPYGPYYIWGATARMLRGLAEVLGR